MTQPTRGLGLVALSAFAARQRQRSIQCIADLGDMEWLGSDLDSNTSREIIP